MKLKLLAATSLLLIILVIAFVILIPAPTIFQMWVLKTLIAFSASFIVAYLTMIETNTKFSSIIFIILFCAIYFYNPIII
jgi:hypothetical protein